MQRIQIWTAANDNTTLQCTAEGSNRKWTSCATAANANSYCSCNAIYGKLSLTAENNTTTTTVLQPFVRDYLGELVLEETAEKEKKQSLKSAQQTEELRQ